MSFSTLLSRILCVSLIFGSPLQALAWSNHKDNDKLLPSTLVNPISRVEMMGLFSDVSISSDGKLYTYYSASPGSQFFTLNLCGPSGVIKQFLIPQRESENSEEPKFEHAFTRDGQKLIYVNDEYEFMVYDIKSDKLTNTHFTIYFYSQWSPTEDGEHLLHKINEQLTLINLNTMEYEELKLPTRPDYEYHTEGALASSSGHLFLGYSKIKSNFSELVAYSFSKKKAVGKLKYSNLRFLNGKMLMRQLWPEAADPATYEIKMTTGFWGGDKIQIEEATDIEIPFPSEQVKLEEKNGNEIYYRTNYTSGYINRDNGDYFPIGDVRFAQLSPSPNNQHKYLVLYTQKTIQHSWRDYYVTTIQQVKIFNTETKNPAFEDVMPSFTDKVFFSQDMRYVAFQGVDNTPLDRIAIYDLQAKRFVSQMALAPKDTVTAMWFYPETNELVVFAQQEDPDSVVYRFPIKK